MKTALLAISLLLGGCSGMDTRSARTTQPYPVIVTASQRPSANGPAVVNSVVGAGGNADAKTVTTLKPGQQWTFRRIDLWRNEESERFRQELVFPESNQWMVRWTILNSDDPIRRGSITGELFDPATHSFADKQMQGRHEALSFPLAVGKTWRFRYVVVKNTRTIKISQTAVVKDWENIVVPAGTFRALRIEHNGQYNADEGGYTWSGRIR